ncbi:MAG: peptidyl-prolyl cis-trans isomerase [Janthinobacterium lividum]
MQEVPAADGTPLSEVKNNTAMEINEMPVTAQPDILPPFPQSRVHEAAPPKPRVKIPAWLLVSSMFLLGLVVGVAVMRQRAHSQTIIVSVNGATITRDALFAQMQNAIGVQTIRKMVQNDLQLQFAQKKGLAPTDAEVDAEFAKISKRPNFAQALAQSGVGEGDIKDNLRVQMAETAVISQGVTVTEADAQKYYQAQSNPNNPAATFYRPASISLRAIATTTQAQAQQALTELTSQTPFELVATTYSVDTSKANGGLLAPLVFGRSPLHRAPALEKSVFSMKIGDQLGPVFFANQWWIFRCQDKAPATSVPYAQVADQCLTGAKLLKGTAANSKRIQQEFADFQHSSNLQAFWPQYQKVIASH